MNRSLIVLVGVATLCICGPAAGHDHPEGDPLACDSTVGEACYYAFADDFHTLNSPHPDAFGEAYFTLNADRTELSYSLDIEGLDLDPIEANRTAPDDVVGIHLHLNIPGTIGPHVLNIFGWPGEEDADAVFDYEHESLTGIYDISDASINPATGLPFLQNLPLTSKIIYDWLDELEEGELMVAVHTVASGFGAMAIHGHISRVAPEPATSLIAMFGAAVVWLGSRKRRIVSLGTDTHKF